MSTAAEPTWISGGLPRLNGSRFVTTNDEGEDSRQEAVVVVRALKLGEPRRNLIRSEQSLLLGQPRRLGPIENLPSVGEVGRCKTDRVDDDVHEPRRVKQAG